MLILQKTFGPDEIHEIEEYIVEAFGEAKLPQDKHGFIKGDVVVTMEFKPHDRS